MKCSVCLEEIEGKLIEVHIDPIERKKYKIYECPKCEVQFSDPMKGASPEYYYKVDPHRQERRTLKLDWRFKTFLREKIPHKGKLLDIGCGYGNFLLAAKKKGYKVTGIDFDERMIKIAKSLGLEDVEAICFDDFYRKRRGEKFDVITLFDVLEHMEDPNGFMNKVKDLLKPGGYICITVPNRSRPLIFKREEHDYPPQHFTRWNIESLVNFLQNKRLMTVNLISSHFPIYYVRENLFYYLLSKIIVLFKRIIFKQKSYWEITSLPIEFLVNNSFNRKRVSLLKNFLVYKKLKEKIIKIIKNMYIIIAFPFFFSLWCYFKLKNPFCGCFLYSVVQFKNNHCKKFEN